jgi:CO dehydrogenase/acetyl-CoA synthase beta subunit
MSESFAELGGPKLGSRAAILATAEEGSVEDGRITLIGPDQLQEGDSYAWGIAVFVEAPDSLEETYLQARRQNLGNAIEGCMLKSPLENAWCRVGTAAAAKGLRPLDVAAAYLAKTKQTVKDAKVEVLMELAPPQGLGEFAALLQNESDRYLQVLGADMSSRGVDLNCVPGSHCGSCADKQACAEIQKMRRARKAASGDQKER